MRKTIILILVGSLLGAGTALLWAQNQPTRTKEEVAVRSFNNVQKKLLDMAKDFPEDKFNYKPHPDSRSFIEEIWHVTSSAEAVAAQFKGEQPDFQKIFSYDGRPKDRAGMVAALEKANKEAGEALEASLAEKYNPGIMGWVEHSGEHYGKLVTIFRVNGEIPPVTKAAQMQSSGD